MIGIIGGLGPMSGIETLKKILEETNANIDREHLAVLLSSQPGRISSPIDYLLGMEPTNPSKQIAQIAIELEKAGATVIGMPSNTAHTSPIFDEIKKELLKNGSAIKFLNMIEELANYILEKYANKKVGVLVTKGTKNNGLYENTFRAKGIPLIAIDGPLEEKIHKAIYDKTYGLKHVSSPATNRAHDALVSAIHELKGLGAEVIVFGCNVIPMALTEKSYYGLPVLDPNRILARSLITHENYRKLRED